MADAALITCAGCGAVCDDMVIDLPHLRPACRLADDWLRARLDAAGPAARIGDREVPVAEALAHAAQLLRGARRPLVRGFGGATVEAVRAAVALADDLGAVIDTDGAQHDGHAGAATALRGSSTATLGEIRDRAGVVVVWREDPETTHPRLLERLRLTPGARQPGRMLVVVDETDTATSRLADVHLRIAPDDDLELLRRLQAAERGLPVAPGELDGDVQALLALLHAVPNAAVLHGAGLSGGDGGHRRALALHDLVRALNDRLHAVTLVVRRTAGAQGAEDALAWQTGFPGRVDLGSGHPELLAYGPEDLGDRGIDVLLAVETDPVEMPGTVVIAVSSTPAPGADVELRTAAAGLGVGGTVHRMDGVPLALQVPLPVDRPGAAEVLLRLREEMGG